MSEKNVSLQSTVFDCALVLEGGGFRASYTAGMVNVLLDQHLYFDYACGLSAGASHVVDYASRDRARVRRSFIDFASLPDKGGLRSILRGKGFFDADYDYTGCIEDGFMPFDWDTFASNPMKLAFQSFDAATGKTVVFHKQDFANTTHMAQCVRMSSTLPGFMHPITLDGHLMFDGGLGEGAGIPTCMAEHDGYDKFLFIATRPFGYRKTPPVGAYRQLLEHARIGQPKVADAMLSRWARYNIALEHMEDLARAGKALIIYPEIMPVASTTQDVGLLRDAYLLGYEQGVRELPRIRTFLFGAPDAGPCASSAEWLENLEADRRALSQPLDAPTVDPESESLGGYTTVA
ncbi:MAG: patatin-like phospholipase family protein [Atopobiaceae bacterium]|jgi:predicted patatin/cPLA2 family phospholipase